MKNLKNKKGFTLIELIVVLAILGILMLILVPSFLGYANDAKQQVRQANARTLWTAAKAAETKVEYTKDMKVEDCAKGGTFKAGSFCKEIEDKAGSSFAGKFSVDTDDIKVTSVTFNDGTACTYSVDSKGNLGFGETCK